MTRGLKRFCKECEPGSKRPAPHPGPRCTTHHRARLKAARDAAHASRILKTYGITKEQYDDLYASQKGRCYICRRATGRTRRLSVDHDHETGFVRGLLCRPCNTFLGHLRDDPEGFDRGGDYLRKPPAYPLIGKVKPDGEHDS